MTVWVVCALFSVLLIWAAVAHLDIVAVANGRLVPQTYVKIVQPAESGIVKEILVEEGDPVRQGQVYFPFHRIFVVARTGTRAEENL